jgi:hypothetical protein
MFFDLIDDAVLEKGSFLSSQVYPEEGYITRQVVSAMLAEDGRYGSICTGEDILYVGPDAVLTEGPIYNINSLGEWRYQVLWLHEEGEWLGWLVYFEVSSCRVRVLNPEAPDYRAQEPHDIPDPEPCYCPDAEVEELRLGGVLGGHAVTTGYKYWCRRHEESWFSPTPILAGVTDPTPANITGAMEYMARQA